jgi:hypothetical protein
MIMTLDLPEDVASRLARQVAAADRETFVVQAIRRALPRFSEDELASIAADVEADQGLREEMRDFEACLSDGLDDHA